MLNSNSRAVNTLLIIFCICVNSFGQTSPLEYTGEAFLQPTDKATTSGKIKALVIGISKYRELPKEAQLNFAHTDATNFYQFLTSQAGGKVEKSDIKLLLNEDATAAEIYAGLDWLLDSQKNDRVIIFFAGHGDVENRTIKQRGFLLAHDSPRAGYHAGGTVKVIDLHDYLETLVTQNKANVLLITDACRAGKLAGGDTGQAQTTASLQEQWAGITKILSSQPGEKSNESEIWGGGYGVFTYHLLDGLKGLADKNGDGFVSLSEVNLYLSNSVPQDTEDKQNPIVSGSMQIKLSQVDPAELAAIKTRKDLSTKNAPMVATRDNITKDTLNEKTEKYYRSFRDAMNTKDYMTTPGKNALHFYRLIEAENTANASFVSDLRRALVAGLESKTQKVINRYMVNDKKLNEDEIHNASVELKTAVDLLGSSDIRYKSLQARQLFLENGFLYCICHDTESSNEEASAALHKLRTSLKFEPDAAYVYNSMGNVHYSRKNYDSAKYYYLRASELAPKWSYPFNNLGTLYGALDNKKEAIKYYNMAKEIDPDFAHIYNNIGNLYSNEKSIPYYQKALELDPEGGATYLFNLGLQLIYKKNTRDQAYSYFDKLVNYESGGYYLSSVVDILYEQQILERMHEYYYKTIEAYQKEISANPDQAYLFTNLASMYATYESYGIYDLLSGNGMPTDSMDMTDEMSNMAMVNYRKAISIDSSDPTLYVQYGDYFYDEDRYGQTRSLDSAIFYYEKSLSLNPEERNETLFTLADAYMSNGNSSKALTAISEALKLCDEEDKPAYMALYAEILWEEGNSEEAIDTMKAALAKGYEAQSYEYNQLATWMIQKEQLNNTRETLDTAIKLAKKEKDNDELAKAYLLLARVEMKEKKIDAALTMLSNSLREDSDFLNKIEQEEDFESLHENSKYKTLIAKYTKDK